MAAQLAAADLDAMRIRDRIAFAVRLRLEMAERHKEAVRRALAFLALPGNAGLAVRSLYRTVDAIWWACGDRSTDFNFYTMRSEEHTSELQSLMRISYAVFCLQKKNTQLYIKITTPTYQTPARS